MAIFRTLKVQSLQRLKAPTFYTTTPPNQFSPAVFQANPPATSQEVNRNGVRLSDIEISRQPITLLYQYPPRSVVLYPPAPETLVKYHVYDPYIAFVGNKAVVTEGGVRVVYLTADQAKKYVTGFVIGLTPWAVVTYANRKLIASYFKNYFPYDLPPVVNTPLVDQTGTETVALTPYTFAANSFWDPDDHSKTLTYSAKRIGSNGKDTDLPTWLNFNASTRTFSGTPTAGSAGVYNIRVHATDPWGRSVADVFTYTISA